MSESVFSIEKRRWSPYSSYVTEIDPRTRILLTLLFAITVVTLGSFKSLFFALGLSFTAILASDMPFVKTFRRVLMMDSFVIFMLATLPFTIPGNEAFSLFGFPASWQGLERAAQIALRANAIILMMLSLIGNLEPVTFGHALFRLKVPESLVQLLLFTIRYIEVIHQEYLRLRISMKARCFRPSNSRHTYISFGYLIGMMLVRAMDRSERILEAMKCRGFSGQILILDHLEFSKKDLIFSSLFITGLLFLFLLEYSYAASL